MQVRESRLPWWRSPKGELLPSPPSLPTPSSPPTTLSWISSFSLPWPSPLPSSRHLGNHVVPPRAPSPSSSCFPLLLGPSAQHHQPPPSSSSLPSPDFSSSSFVRIRDTPCSSSFLFGKSALSPRSLSQKRGGERKEINKASAHSLPSSFPRRWSPPRLLTLSHRRVGTSLALLLLLPRTSLNSLSVQLSFFRSLPLSTTLTTTLL